MSQFFDPKFKNHDYSSDLVERFDKSKVKEDDILGYEFQHAHYVKHESGKSDILFIREWVHLKDGRRLLNYRVVKNYERPYWLTKPHLRTHTDVLEYAPLEMVDEYRCPQWCLEQDIAENLRYYGRDRSLKALAATKWLYGANVSPISYIRHEYRKRWPNCKSPSSTVAWVDSETDMHGTDETIIVQASYKKRAIVAVVRWWIEDQANISERFYEALYKMMGEVIEKRQCNVELLIVENAGEAVAEVMKRVHSWETDYAEVWNINYDVPRFGNVLDKYGFNPGHVFCHPEVPEGYRQAFYIKGPEKRTSKKGIEFKMDSKEQWDTFDVPGPVWIDGMQYYYNRRRVNGKMSASLDSCLKRHTPYSKIKFNCGVLENTADWHKKMQKDFKIEYLVYAAGDCIFGEILDEEIGDLSTYFKVDLGNTDLKSFTSLPKQFNDSFHHFIYDNERHVLGCPSNSLGSEFDSILIDQYDWIVTLPTHNLEPKGIPVIKGLPNLRSNILVHSADADVVRTYPMVTVNANVSRETCYKEPTTQMVGMTEQERREFSVNWTGADVNAIQLCVMGLGLIYPDEWVELYDKQKQKELA